jgi:hypothetical protein
MIIISGGRGIGKTRMLLEQVADAGGVLICEDPATMRARAHKYGITGLDIVSYEEQYTGEKPVYIHDINKFLLGHFGNVKGYTQCTE